MRWITALSLEQWADRLDARNVFPGMIADLIRASAKDISTIRFPNGDKGQVRGFDGVLEAVGVPPYVPDGMSIWEFGVSADAATKANTDFAKRTKEVDAAQRKQTTFVFVTPRTWNNGKKKLGDWVSRTSSTISTRRIRVNRAFLWMFIRLVSLRTGGLAISSFSNPVRMNHNNLLKHHN